MLQIPRRQAGLSWSKPLRTVVNLHESCVEQVQGTFAKHYGTTAVLHATKWHQTLCANAWLKQTSNARTWSTPVDPHTLFGPNSSGY
jgi:hypothetical protein